MAWWLAAGRRTRHSPALAACVCVTTTNHHHHTVLPTPTPTTDPDRTEVASPRIGCSSVGGGPSWVASDGATAFRLGPDSKVRVYRAHISHNKVWTKYDLESRASIAAGASIGSVDRDDGASVPHALYQRVGLLRGRLLVEADDPVALGGVA
eukprot:COSAG02_NODE_14999_length_1216_cov_1.236347_1_plen_151_part_10